MSAAPAAFLDRDGTLVVDHGYLADSERVELLPGGAEAVAALRRNGYRIIVVTNQSGIERGTVSHQQVAAIHCRLQDLLVAGDPGAIIDAFYYCPHRPDDRGEPHCCCRKPLPGLLLRAAADHRLDLSRSVAVGDAERDVLAGWAAGCRLAVRVGPGAVTSLADALPLLVIERRIRTEGLHR